MGHFEGTPCQTTVSPMSSCSPKEEDPREGSSEEAGLPLDMKNFLFVCLPEFLNRATVGDTDFGEKQKIKAHLSTLNREFYRTFSAHMNVVVYRHEFCPDPDDENYVTEDVESMFKKIPLLTEQVKKLKCLERVELDMTSFLEFESGHRDNLLALWEELMKKTATIKYFLFDTHELDVSHFIQVVSSFIRSRPEGAGYVVELNFRLPLDPLDFIIAMKHLQRIPDWMTIDLVHCHPGFDMDDVQNVLNDPGNNLSRVAGPSEYEELVSHDPELDDRLRERMTETGLGLPKPHM
jgi:hypothetical protein